MKARRISSLCLVMLGIALSPAIQLALADTTTPPSAGDAEGMRATTVLTIHGTVTAVDKAEKLVTIQVPNGPTIHTESREPLQSR
jgi:hypothetical protein